MGVYQGTPLWGEKVSLLCMRVPRYSLMGGEAVHGGTKVLPYGGRRLACCA